MSNPKSKNILIVLLLVALGVSLYFNYVCHSKQPGPLKAGEIKAGGLIDSAQADAILLPYQDTSVYLELAKSKKVFGAYFDPGIASYFTTTFPKFVASHQMEGYEWEVGIYFAIKKDPKGGQQLTACLIPTAVNVKTLQAADYLTHKNFYYKQGNGGVGGDGDEFIYDTGTLFP